MIVQTLQPAPGLEWDAYVRCAAHGTVCHLPGWSRAVEKTWGHTPHHLSVMRAGRMVGLLPLFHVRSRLFGSMLVSIPNAVYGGALADDDGARRQLIEEAKAIARRRRVDYLELRDHVERGDSDDPELLRKDLYVTFDCPLTADEPAMLASLPRDIRRMVRQGPKHGLMASRGGAELLDDFYDVYASSVRNLGTPVFPKRLFANLLAELPDSDILLIRQADRVAGGVLSFYFRGAVMPYYGGAYQEFYRTGVNNFMYWELMRSAAARGCTRFDFGRSKIGTGAYQFKRGWGMTERALPYRFLLVGAGRMPDLSPLNAKYESLIRLWKSLPLPVTKLAGPVIARGLP